MNRPLFAALGLAVLVFAPGLMGQFVFDDLLLIEQNLLTGAPSLELLRVELWESTPRVEGAAGSFYRPAMLVSLAIDRTLFGLSPFAHRLHSLLLHLAAGGLLWTLGRSWKLGPSALAFGVALFLVHPAQVETVSFVAARNDILATVWMLIALIAAASTSPGRLLLTTVAALMAASSKESALALPLVFAVSERARTGRWGAPLAHCAILFGLLAYVGLRAWAGVPLPETSGAAELVLPAIVRFLTALVHPTDHYAATTLTDIGLSTWPWALLAVAALGSSASGGPRAWAGLGIAALALLPAFGGVLSAGIAPDRYLYLPLAGLGLAAAASLERRPLPRPILLVAVAVIAACSLRMIPMWMDNVSLFEAAVRHQPTNYAHGSLAKAYEAQGRLDEAAAQYHHAVTGEPFLHSCFNIALMEMKRQNAEGAARQGSYALDQGCPAVPELVAPTALGFAMLGQWEQARALAERVDEDPTGLAVVIRAAEALRRGDRSVLEAEAAARGRPPEELELAAQRLLEQAQGPNPWTPR